MRHYDFPCHGRVCPLRFLLIDLSSEIAIHRNIPRQPSDAATSTPPPLDTEAANDSSERHSPHHATPHIDGILQSWLRRRTHRALRGQHLQLARLVDPQPPPCKLLPQSTPASTESSLHVSHRCQPLYCIGNRDNTDQAPTGSSTSSLTRAHRSSSNAGRRRSNVLMNLQLNDPSVPAPGEMVSEHGIPQHHRAPSLGELHQELEAEQEAHVVSEGCVLIPWTFADV